jgi:hypothetical protein
MLHMSHKTEHRIWTEMQRKEAPLRLMTELYATQQ